MIVQFLEKVGVDNQVIAQLKDPEEGLNVDELAKEFKENQREVYANDPDVVKRLRTEAKGKERGSIEREIKRVYGITTEEWEENKFGEEKDYKKVLEFGRKKIETQNTTSKQDLVDENHVLKDKIKWYDDERIPEIQSESKNEVNKFYIERHLQKLIEKSGDITVSARAATILVKEGLKDKGLNSSLTENLDGVLFKTNEGLVPQDEGKTRNLTNMEVIKGILSTEKVLVESKATPVPPVTPPVISQPITDKPESLGEKIARENLAEIQDMKPKPRGT